MTQWPARSPSLTLDCNNVAFAFLILATTIQPRGLPVQG